MRNNLVIMLKEPRPGRVKTRLAAEIGSVPATWWFRHQTARLIRRVGHDPRWRCWLAVSPDRAVASRAIWPADLPRVAQGAGDLGARMARVFRAVPGGPTLIVGGDIPGITAPVVARAFGDLAGHDAVFGPAPDGGYWCVGRGMRRVASGFLEGVRWSSAHAMQDSIASLGPDARIATTTTLQDIDTLADLIAYDGAERQRRSGQRSR